ncbi:hypothetical protein EAI_13279 [Harpegnathos saltator]|uniref:Uncharacterized protein n=1 Tax=Harpegnathos saltator TaxID=610380 RepID=E2C4X0_HARSA|nr:hypothetical protein EAI_13279 [Harpegnathos saltator]
MLALLKHVLHLPTRPKWANEKKKRRCLRAAMGCHTPTANRERGKSKTSHAQSGAVPIALDAPRSEGHMSWECDTKDHQGLVGKQQRPALSTGILRKSKAHGRRKRVRNEERNDNGAQHTVFETVREPTSEFTIRTPYGSTSS